ncbi:monofunctional biosynthetic peptidoglycan transglycosylase [Sinisalibacter aestuarii]|uniref:Biosynthetic peptidoglycan transglycosylase n=1 Tax=Sinisalibacter aestuarii TaxID=2949426 RepID=A0ABQ5LQT1_9RHOB|nr:monofunctional biosynthetic peptidoglycan transglycosylase [Sinisalibacter aestuarii]GKY86621.1 monofunctional biosynthetic peptidoglycan transglycosylase [Sinisalibacter aestuarii]
MTQPDDTRPPSLTFGILRGLWRLLRRYLGRVTGFVWRWLRLALIVFFTAVLTVTLLYTFVNPPTTLYIASEKARLGEVRRDWVDLEEIAPVMVRAVVAAEDANFCAHWGFDMTAIRQVIAEGESRGASTITQQTVKNVYLWPARSWPRKAFEAVITPIVELIWSKRRVLEVYLNMIEFDTGVFGVEAAARQYFGKSAADLNADQAARLAAILPNPKDRSAAQPTQFILNRSASIRDGAETIRLDGRAACFED